MRKYLLLSAVVVIAAMVAGGYYFFTHFEIQGLGGVQILPRGGSSPADPSEGQPLSPAPNERATLRIGTFNFAPLDERKMMNPGVIGNLAQAVREFDVLAVQDIQCRDQSVLVTFLEQLNAGGRHYGFVVPPSVGRDPVEQYMAFLYDKATIQVDPATVYAVGDPARHFRRAPLVASFRARGPPPDHAFTFTLINVHLDSARTAEELAVLDDVYRAVRDDGRNEDDILLLGDFGRAEGRPIKLEGLPQIVAAFAPGDPALGSLRLPDNLLFDRRATVEFAGRYGFSDLMRMFRLTAAQAAEISDHLPVWAEFSVFEGGPPRKEGQTAP